MTRAVTNPKAIGTRAESAVEAFLKREGVRAINPLRIAQGGAVDEGDITYTTPTGRKVIVQVKAGKSAERASVEQCAKWTSEAAAQAGASRAHWGFLVTKRAGFGAPRAEHWRAHIHAASLGLPSTGVIETDLATMVALLGSVL